MHCYAFLSDELLFTWLAFGTIVSLRMVVLNSRDRPGIYGLHKKHTWINSSVIVSAEKSTILVQLYQC